MLIKYCLAKLRERIVQSLALSTNLRIDRVRHQAVTESQEVAYFIEFCLLFRLIYHTFRVYSVDGRKQSKIASPKFFRTPLRMCRMSSIDLQSLNWSSFHRLRGLLG